MGTDIIFVGNDKPYLIQLMTIKKYLETHTDTVLSTTKDGKLFFMRHLPVAYAEKGTVVAYTLANYWRDNDGTLLPMSIGDAKYMITDSTYTKQESDTFYVLEIDVNENMQGKGIGSAMLQYLMDLSAMLGYNIFTLDSCLDIAPNRDKNSKYPYVDKNFAFYKKMGMVPDGRYGESEELGETDISICPMIKMLDVVKPARSAELKIFFTQERIDQQNCLREKINNSCKLR